MELGKMTKLQVVSKVQSGIYLNKEGRGQDDIYLPLKHGSEEVKVGDELEVFVYPDTEGKIRAALDKPKLTLGELAVLKVVNTTNFGAFLDWGLEKDLLLPLKEQVGKVKIGDSCLVALFLNSSRKLCATMRVYDLLSSESPYKENDRVHGTIYRINKDFGAFVAVDNKYHGLIPNNELYGSFTEGDDIEVRIKKVRQDGKLELSLRQKAHTEIEGDARKILDRLKASGGNLRVNDDSSPELIKAQFQMSKSAFKRALGRLLKEGAIVITDEGIKLMW